MIPSSPVPNSHSTVHSNPVSSSQLSIHPSPVSSSHSTTATVKPATNPSQVTTKAATSANSQAAAPANEKEAVPANNKAAAPANSQAATPATTKAGTSSVASPCAAISSAHAAQLQQVAQLRKLNIPMPPYLAGYTVANLDANTGLGCGAQKHKRSPGEPPNTNSSDNPCALVTAEHEVELAQIQALQAQSIGVPPFLAGYAVASIDAKKQLGCPDTPQPEVSAGAASSNRIDPGRALVRLRCSRMV